MLHLHSLIMRDTVFVVIVHKANHDEASPSSRLPWRLGNSTLVE